jgi:hypothetical protein
MRVERTRASEQYDIQAEGGSKKSPTPTEPKLEAGSAELVNRHDAARRKGPTGAEQKRVDTARSTMQRLAAQLPGHGVNIDALAASFGGAKYAAHDGSQIAARATYAFVRTALENHPELADRAIGMRMSGASVVSEMKTTVKAFDAVATKIGEMNREFDAAAAHAAAHVALSAIMAGHGGHAVHGVGEAVKAGVKHSVEEAAIMDAVH